MPNFFKKLTSSFKMGEDDIFEDTPEENTVPPYDLGEDEGSQDSNLESTETPGEAEGVEDSQEEKGASQEEEPHELDDNGLDSEERPYTIAQLVQARTAEKSALKPSKSKLPGIKLHVTENLKEGELNIPEGQLAIDVYETPSEIVVKSTIAGAKPEELDIGIEENTINIRGARHNEEKVKGEDYLYQECYWGTFSRSIILPTEVDSDKAEASLKDGVLTIRIPKVIKEREKKIKVMT